MVLNLMARVMAGGVNSITHEGEFEKVDEDKLPEAPDGFVSSGYWPRLDKKPMPRKAVCAIFCAYMWYDYKGRRLDRVEVAVLMKWKLYPSYNLKNPLFDRFENHEDRITKIHQELDDEKKQAWKFVIDQWVEELLSKDPEAKARFETLSGLSNLIANWLGVDTKTLYPTTMDTWDDPDSTTSQEAAEFTRPHRGFYARKALHLQIAFEKNVLRMPDRSEAEFQEYEKRVLDRSEAEFQKDHEGFPTSLPRGATTGQAPEGDPLVTATTGIGELSMTATAPSPSALNTYGPGPYASGPYASGPSASGPYAPESSLRTRPPTFPESASREEQRRKDLEKRLEKSVRPRSSTDDRLEVVRQGSMVYDLLPGPPQLCGGKAKCKDTGKDKGKDKGKDTGKDNGKGKREKSKSGSPEGDDPRPKAKRPRR
ncbi:MAG: hypothetical protein Q9161_005182 [Pseudevernia consocians]